MLSMFGVSADKACELVVSVPTTGGEEGGDIDVEENPEFIIDETIEEFVGTTFTFDGYNAMIVKNYESAVYLVNIWNSNFDFDLYFTFEAVDIGEGAYSLMLTYFARPDFEVGKDEYLDTVIDYTVVIGGETEDDGEGETGGDVTVDLPETSGIIYDEAENEVEITEADIEAGKIYLSFMAYNGGEYVFTSNDLYVSAVYTSAGVLLEKNENWCYVLEEYSSYVVEINTSYVYAAGTYTLTPEYQYPLGHQNNPAWLYSLGEATDVSVDAYGIVWHQFYASANGTLTVTTADSSAVILVTASFGYELDGQGTISMDVIKGRKYYIGIGNMSTEALETTFTPVLVEGEIETNGTINVPHIMVNGENVADIPAWDCQYFVYTANGNGTLTLTTTDENASWYISDLQSPAYATTDKTLTVHLEEGQKIYLYVETADWKAGQIAFNASFTADPVEVYTPVSIEEPTTITLEANTYGGFSLRGDCVISWDNADALVYIVAWGEEPTLVTNGQSITGGMWGTNLNVYFPDYAAGTVTITVTPAN